MPDAVIPADAIKDVAAEHGLQLRVAAAVLRQVGKGHVIVGQHGVDGVWESGDDAAKKVCSVHLPRIVAELDVGELGDAVYRQEHDELALCQAQVAGVDMDVADRRTGEAAPFGGLIGRGGQAGDAVSLEASMQARAREPRDGVAQASENIVERQQGATTELDDHRLLDRGQRGAPGTGRAHRSIAGCRTVAARRC